MQTLRFADPITVNQYPLPIAGPAEWRRQADGTWQASVSLPTLPAGHMIVPSLSVLERHDYRFAFSLVTEERTYALRSFPSLEDDGAFQDPSDAVVRTAIDCYHLQSAPGACRLDVRYQGHGPPSRYLLSISMRPTEMDVVAGPLPALRAPAPPRRSQMLANPRIAARICSPMSTAMVIGTHRPHVDYDAVVTACLDRVTGMYGLWPLAIRAASRHGLIGAVELVDGWPPVLACLARGLPVVASIRYAPDALPGAPQRATGGHLVVVHGVESETVLVNDPAAPDHGSVVRRYPAAAFAEAWFRHRGAAYMLVP
ncbi:MAG: C39 family peptidase [Pseudomonadales bacterium]